MNLILISPTWCPVALPLCALEVSVAGPGPLSQAAGLELHGQQGPGEGLAVGPHRPLLRPVRAFSFRLLQVCLKKRNTVQLGVICLAIRTHGRPYVAGTGPRVSGQVRQLGGHFTSGGSLLTGRAGIMPLKRPVGKQGGFSAPLTPKTLLLKMSISTCGFASDRERLR